MADMVPSGLTDAEYRLILRNDLFSFICRAFYELNPDASLVPSPHIEIIANALERVFRGGCQRLIINLPPRSLKSLCVSIAFVAWLMGREPSAQIICASYGQDLSDKLARDCRRVMQSGWYQHLFPTRLSSLAVNELITTQQGLRLATSVGGVLTGRGADWIIVDDPLKPEEALSQSQRGRANEWFDNTLITRLNDKNAGRIIVVMQRLHQDDLVGHLIERDQWEVLSLPAIAVMDETFTLETLVGRRVLTRRSGEALDPEREPLATLRTLRENIGTYNFESQYQQSPVPAGGAIVRTEWLRFYARADRPERFTRVVQSWDTANKATELNDYSVCTTWGVAGQHCYLFHVYRDRVTFPDLKRKVLELAGQFGATEVLVEDRASGTQLIQELHGVVFGLVGVAPPPNTDKIMRLHAHTAQFESGFVLLPRQASWLDEYIHELTGFPGTRFDDQVDSTTQALARIGSGLSGAERWARLARP